MLEILASLFIIAFAVTVFGTAFPSASQSLSRHRHMDRATDACQQQLEFWRNVGYASLPAIPSGSSSTSQSFTAPTSLPPATGTVTFTRVTDTFATTTTDTGRVRVDATVTWTGVGADKGTVTLSTLILE